MALNCVHDSKTVAVVDRSGKPYTGTILSIRTANTCADSILGERVINGRGVRLLLRAEVVDPGANPLRSHASANYPNTAKPPERPDTQHRRPRRQKRW